MKIPGSGRSIGPAEIGPARSPAPNPFFNFEARLSGLREIQRLFRPGVINQLCSAPINGQPLFSALEQYVGPIAGDKSFSRRMDAVSHTLWVIQSLERISEAHDAESAARFFSSRGLNGLPNASANILELAKTYRSLSDNDKRVLYIAALLHDIGKATGNREKHPKTGLQMFINNPEIGRELRRTLSSYLTDKELDEAEALVASVIGEHDLIGGLGITRDRNIFECALAIIKASPDHSVRQKLLNFLALINFADIDGQSEMGIFTDGKLADFISVSKDMEGILESARDKNINSPDDLITTEKDYAWWGKQRMLAWCRGDNFRETDDSVEELLRTSIPDAGLRNFLYSNIGKISLIDGMYNLATAIHHPAAALRFIIFLADQAGCLEVNTITYDNSFLTDPKIARAIRGTAGLDGKFERLLDLGIFENDSQRTLRLSSGGPG